MKYFAALFAFFIMSAYVLPLSVACFFGFGDKNDKEKTEPENKISVFFKEENKVRTVPLEEYIKRESYCINPERSTVLGICKLGNDAGIVGAANLYRLKD